MRLHHPIIHYASVSRRLDAMEIDVSEVAGANAPAVLTVRQKAAAGLQYRMIDSKLYCQVRERPDSNRKVSSLLQLDRILEKRIAADPAPEDFSL